MCNPGADLAIYRTCRTHSERHEPPDRMYWARRAGPGRAVASRPPRLRASGEARLELDEVLEQALHPCIIHPHDLRRRRRRSDGCDATIGRCAGGGEDL